MSEQDWISFLKETNWRGSEGQLNVDLNDIVNKLNSEYGYQIPEVDTESYIHKWKLND